MLKGFCSQNFTRSIHDQEERVRRAENNVNDYMSSARNAMKQVDEEQMKLLVLRNRACNSGDDEKELVDFFKANKSLIALDKSGNQLWVGVNCYLNDYNEDMLNDSLDEEWKKDFCHELSGNYDGSYVQFRIHTSKDKMSFKVNCTREEYEKIQKKYGDCLGIDGRQVVKELLKG